MNTNKCLTESISIRNNYALVVVRIENMRDREENLLKTAPENGEAIRTVGLPGEGISLLEVHFWK
jgi:hypothetical protein